jgi:hypothetical protein
MSNFKKTTQQDFLREAMRCLKMTKSEFAERIRASTSRLDKWLLPIESAGFCEMDEIVWQFIREVVEQESDLPDRDQRGTTHRSPLT